MSEEFKKAGSVFEQVTAYVNTRVSQAKLSVAEKLSQGIALLVAVLLSALVFFFIFLSVIGCSCNPDRAMAG